jgi:hypothetical protein
MVAIAKFWFFYIQSSSIEGAIYNQWFRNYYNLLLERADWVLIAYQNKQRNAFGIRKHHASNTVDQTTLGDAVSVHQLLHV